MWLRWLQSVLHSSALCLGCATFLTHHTHHCKQFYSGYHQALLFTTNSYLVVTVVYLDKPCIYIVDYSKPPRRWIRQKMGGSFGSNGEIWWGWTKKTSNKNHHSVKPFWNGTPSRIKVKCPMEPRDLSLAQKLPTANVFTCFYCFNEASSQFLLDISWFLISLPHPSRLPHLFHILPDLHHVSVGHK